MNPTHSLAILTNAEPIAWLIILLALYFCGERRTLKLQKHGLGSARYDERPPDYRALGAFVVFKLLAALAYPALTEPAYQVLPFGLTHPTAHIVYTSAYWTLYLLSTVSIFFIIGSLIKNSLTPLPGLSAAALAVYRWVAVLVLLIALTAHLPIYGIRNVEHWLNQIRVSFAICVCCFEVTLLALLVMRLLRLGMSLRSRPIGLGLGLTLLGFMDLVSAVTLNVSAHFVLRVEVLNEAVVLFVLLIWALYIVFPEPKRLAHSLSPASRLMKWDEVARKLDVRGRASEQTPFISGVQLIVDGILDKYKIGGS